MGSANADELSYSCEGWQPSSLLHRGPVSLLLSDEQLVWSNGKKIYGAQFVDGTLTRRTYVDDASVYLVYGFWQKATAVKSRVKIVRIFYNAEILQSSELNCR